VNPEATLHQAFDDGAVWDLDRDEDGIGRCAGRLQDPGRHLSQPLAAMRKARSKGRRSRTAEEGTGGWRVSIA